MLSFHQFQIISCYSVVTVRSEIAVYCLRNRDWINRMRVWRQATEITQSLQREAEDKSRDMMVFFSRKDLKAIGKTGSISKSSLPVVHWSSLLIIKASNTSSVFAPVLSLSIGHSFISLPKTYRPPSSVNCSAKFDCIVDEEDWPTPTASIV